MLAHAISHADLSRSHATASHYKVCRRSYSARAIGVVSCSHIMGFLALSERCALECGSARQR